jgi:hypothetical protein
LRRNPHVFLRAEVARSCIRVETIDYFLRRYREDIIKRRAIEGDMEAQLAALEQTLLGEVALAGD